MSKGAQLIEVIYVDTREPVNVLVGIGDTIRAVDWAEVEYSYPARPELPDGLSAAEIDFRIAEYRRERQDVDAKREVRSGLYAVYLAASRAKLRGAEGDWLDWMSLVTIPDDESDEPVAAEEADAGESGAPQSAS